MTTPASPVRPIAPLDPETILAACALRGLPTTTASRAMVILRDVALVGGVTLDDLRGPGRTRKLARLRDLAVWECRRDGLSLYRIGRALRRDHSTILAAMRREEERRARAGVATAAARRSAARRRAGGVA